MSQLGGEIRFTTRVDRERNTTASRFALRTLPAARRSRHRFAALAAVVGLVGVATFVRAIGSGEDVGAAFGDAGPLLVWGAGIAAFAGTRLRAWGLTRQTFKDMPDEFDVRVRFAESGYDAASGGRSIHFDWSAITAVAEGDRFMALGVGRTHLVSAPIEQLTDAERATIRRWAEAAPDGPQWEVRRTRREHPRLQVSPSGGLAPDERAPIATSD